MQPSSADDPGNRATEAWPFGRGEAWFAFVMTMAVMVFDFIDRQVIVSLFPYIKADWGLSDKELGALASVVSVTVALGALPIALIADRTSRVRSIVVMVSVWSLASIACMFARSYAALFAARAVVGVGEAGYGAVGAALLSSLFPARRRAALLGAFLAASAVGSVLGVLLGGVIAVRWGWQSAFGIVGVPGLVLALLYLRVRDYPTVALASEVGQATTNLPAALGLIRVQVKARTLIWLCFGGAAQLAVVSSIVAWLPSFMNRSHGIPPDQAGVKAALVVLAGAASSVLWGFLIDRAGARRPRNKLVALAGVSALTSIVLSTAFGLSMQGPVDIGRQYALIVVGGVLMSCTLGPVAAMVIDIVHPSLRATGASVLAVIQNLLGLAAGPFITGLLSDAIGLNAALTLVPGFALAAALCFLFAARTYEADLSPAEPGGGAAGAGSFARTPA